MPSDARPVRTSASSRARSRCRRVHALLRFGEETFEVVHVHTCQLQVVGPDRKLQAGFEPLLDPIGLPDALAHDDPQEFPGVRRLYTMIGRRLSMQSEIAVASMTFSRRLSTSR